MTFYTLSNGNQGDAQAKINELTEFHALLDGEVTRLREELADRAESWRLSSVCRAKEARIHRLELELAEQKAHADEIYKAAVDLAAKLESDLAAERAQLAANHEATKLIGKWLEGERALADEMANVLTLYNHDLLAGELMQWVPAHDEALAAWKEARK